jgi:50S ribosomal protein L16 3-hydroxylase
VAAKRSRPIEVDPATGRPLGMTPARFLRDYWQKQPLLIRGAFPQFHNAISPDDLAGLACEEAALARLVIRDERRDRWTVRSGPFAEADFAKLPKAYWTLLVQDVDKWDADVAALLEEFAFLPSWRIDDVMISYATDGGGVGAHVDQYDVFLVQGIGQRRWRISTDPNAPLAFRDDVELKLLKQFTPTHDWILQPGDALYLPPGVPHDGVAIGNCMTYSVGMRAPSVAELVIDLAESVAEPLGEERRYVDPDLAPARETGEIDAAAMQRVMRSLAALRDLDDDALRSWFGRFITRYRSAHEAAAAPKAISAQHLATRLERSRFVRHPWSRVAWTRSGRHAQLFVAGEAHTCSAAFARLLASRHEVSGAEIRAAARRGDLEALTALINAGHFAIARKR